MGDQEMKKRPSKEAELELPEEAELELPEEDELELPEEDELELPEEDEPKLYGFGGVGPTPWKKQKTMTMWDKMNLLCHHKSKDKKFGKEDARIIEELIGKTSVNEVDPNCGYSLS